MGWNEGYTICEATVIGAYNADKLDKALLAVLMEPYRDTDIDSGGRVGTLATDGKCFEEIVVETFGLALPEKPEGRPPDGWSDEWSEYFERLSEQMGLVTEHFGWH